MKKCIIIGGGLAGLSAAVHLIKKSYKVTLLEASPKLGGRTYSFIHEKHNHHIDNGQHLMMGCYKNTLELLKIINAESEVEIQDRLNIPFLVKGGKEYNLNAPANLYPFNLLYAIMNYKALSLQERFSVLKFFINEILFNAHQPENLIVDGWLKKGGQSSNSISSLWEILSVGTLNSSQANASAAIFRDVLREVFLTGNNSAKIIFPKNSLSETFSDKVRLYIQRNGGEILLSERVCSINLDNGKMTGLKTSKNNYSGFDCAIAAIPLQALDKIEFLPSKPHFTLPQFEYSPILSIHFWLKQNTFKKRFYGLIDSKVHWLFNNGTHITLIASAADDLIHYSNQEITKLFCNEIKNYFPEFNEDEITDAVVIKEKRATFIPTIASNRERNLISNPVTNLYLSGDWTNTQLPATIEGAIKSGRTTADLIMNR